MPRLNVTAKFIGYLILLSILPLLVVGFVSFQISSDILQDEVSQYTMELIVNQRDYIDLQLQQFESLMANLSGVDEIRDALESPDVESNSYTSLLTQAHIGYILNGYSNLEGLASIDIFTTNGEHYHVGDTLNTNNIRTDIQQRIFDETLNSDDLVHWVGIEENVNTNSTFGQVITASKILYTFNRETLKQEPIALFLVNYSVDTLYEHLRPINLGDNAYILIVDTKERIVYHPDKSQLGQVVHRSIADLIATGSDTIVANVDGEDFSINITQSDISGWTIIGLIPIATLTAKSTIIQSAVVIILFICFVAVTVVGWFFNRSVVNPIREITHQFKLMQKNPNSEVNYSVPVRGNDEITELSRWFNSTQALFRSSHALIEYRELDVLLKNAVNSIAVAMTADRITLITLDVEARQIKRYVAGGRGADDVVRITFDELCDGLSGWVIRERQPAYSPKNILDPRETSEVQQRRLETNCGDIIVVPLIYRGEIRGTVTAINAPDDPAFTTQDVELLVALSNQTMIAIENAQLVQSVKASEEKFMTAFHASPEPMTISRLKNEEFVEINDSFLLATGYNRSDVIGNSSVQLNIWKDQSQHEAFVQMIQENRYVHDFEALFQSCEGDQLVWLMSCEIIDIEGEECLLSVFKDITGRKELEEQRLRVSLERERVQILADFFTEASHEFKTPLSIINTNAYLLKRKLNTTENNDYPDHTERLDRISDQVSVISTLIDSLIQMTKLDSGGQELVMSIVDIKDIVRSIYYEMISKSEQANISTQLDLCEAHLQVKGDAHYLRRTLEILYDNAIKFNQSGGTLTLRVDTDDTNCIIEVIDTGIGLINEDKARIFERFFQADKAGTLRGFGLGLPIAKATVELHGGHIEVDSVPGEGSTFRILLPLIKS